MTDIIADKNRVGLMGPEQAKKLAKAITTDSGQVLTTPTINGGVLSGTFSGTVTRTGSTTMSVGNSTSNADFLLMLPTDYGIGKPGLLFKKTTGATIWTIDLYDTSSNAGTINFNSGKLTHGDLSIATLNYTTISSDADVTLAAADRSILHTGTLTANRAMTLPTGVTGRRLRITRTGSGAFNLNVGTGPLKALATNTWCEVTYDGAAWYLSAYGAL